MSGHRALRFTTEGLKQRLASMERAIADLQRSGGWQFDDESGLAEGFANGTETIVDGESAVVVTHRLSATPEAVLATGWEAEVLGVTARNATTFTVSRTGTTGALKFDWIAQGTTGEGSTSYYDAVLADAPSVFWPLNDLSGTVVDALAGPDGAYGGGPLLGVPGPGSLDSAVEFDATDDKAYVGTGIAATCTMEIWFRVDALPSSDGLICGYTATDGGSGGVTTSIGIRSTGEVYGYLYDSAAKATTGGVTVAAGVWHHVALVVTSGVQMELYVNGALSSTLAVGAVFVSFDGYQQVAGQAGQTGAANTLLRIGGRRAAYAYYAGALSSTDIADHYAAA